MYKSYLTELNIWQRVVEKSPKSLIDVPRFSIGEWILICLMWVSLPFWWLLITAIWIMKVRIGLSWMSLMGMTNQPVGSFKSITSTSCRSVKFVPARTDILKMSVKIYQKSSKAFKLIILLPAWCVTFI